MLPLSYRNSLYNNYLTPYPGYLGQGYGYDPYLRPGPYLPLNYRPLEYDLNKRYQDASLLKSKYSYYQPELYKTSYNYSNPYSLVNPLAHPILSDALSKADPKLIADPKKKPKGSLPSLVNKPLNKKACKQIF